MLPENYAGKKVSENGSNGVFANGGDFPSSEKAREWLSNLLG